MNKKIRKLIFKGLVATILFSSVLANTFAETLVKNGRYEVFEGSDVIINNILEDGDVYVEVEGNTVVNLLGDMDNLWNKIIKKRDQYQYIDGDLIIPNNENFHGWGWHNLSPIPNIKGNTVYTLFFTKDATPRMEFGYVDENGTGKSLVTHRNVSKVTVTSPSNGDLRIKFCVQNPATENNPINLGKIILLEGDWTQKEIPDYFEGMKSVGQNNKNGHKIKFLSTDLKVNLSDIEKGKSISYGGTYPDGSGFDLVGRSRIMNLEVKENMHITIEGVKPIRIHFYDKNKEWLGQHNINVQSFTTPINCRYIGFAWDSSKYDDNALKVTSSNQDEKEILLNEPLRGLPNGVKDRFVKIDGKWFIERNCDEVVLNGTEEWYNSEDKYTNVVAFYTKSVSNFNSSLDKQNLISNSFKTSKYYDDEEGITSNKNTSSNNLPSNIMRIKINSDKLSSKDVLGLKKWLSQNPVTVVYQIANPIYEELEIKPILKTWLGTAYISNNSSITPTSMKVTVDRVANRAQEAIELAKVNPTVQNISIARMWINLMQDSILKDQFNEDANNIIEIEDMEIEKKKASANLDLYVKSENMLSMSLSTNSVTFENYSGVEDLEILNAVSINVNSSLPYDLNAYLTDEIYNRDKSKSIDIKTLNIREGSKSNYNQFNSVAEKLVLKDNCEAANGIIHNIDLKLSNDDSHDADVYKTVIKFEVEQK